MLGKVNKTLKLRKTSTRDTMSKSGISQTLSDDLCQKQPTNSLCASESIFGPSASCGDTVENYEGTQAFPCENSQQKNVSKRMKQVETEDISSLVDDLCRNTSSQSPFQASSQSNLSKNNPTEEAKDGGCLDHDRKQIKDLESPLEFELESYSNSNIANYKNFPPSQSNNFEWKNSSSSNFNAKSESEDSLCVYKKIAKPPCPDFEGISLPSQNMFCLSKKSEASQPASLDSGSQICDSLCMPQFDETSKKLPSSDKDREELNSLNLDSCLLNSVENIDIIFLDPSQIPSWNSKANEISFGHQNCYENMVSPSVRFGKSSEQNEGMSAPEIPNISDFDSCSIFKDYTGSDNRQKVYINVGDRYKGERAWEKIYQLSNHLEKCNREEIISFITRIKKNQNMGGCKSSTCSRNGLSRFERSTINDRVSSSVSKSSIVYPCRLQQRIFRLFRKCFKVDFEEFLKEKKIIFHKVAKDMDRDTFNDFLIEFLDYYYPNILEKLDDEVLEKIMETMSLFILKQRHKKNYKITEGLDFEAWNSLVNQPKSEKFIQFFSLPENAFIYCFFFYKECKLLVEEPTSSVCRKNSKDSNEALSLFNQMHELFNEFQIFVSESVREEISHLTQLYLQQI